jgi:hypothetical protein
MKKIFYQSNKDILNKDPLLNSYHLYNYKHHKVTIDYELLLIFEVNDQLFWHFHEIKMHDNAIHLTKTKSYQMKIN